MSKHIYTFNWKQGGWNYVHDTNIRSARKQAREKWSTDLKKFDGEPVLTIDEDSFKRVTFEEFERILATDGFN
jgi:hypothetical protein